MIIVDDREVRAGLAHLIDIGQNPRRYLTAIGGFLKSSTQLRLDAGVTPEGRRFKPVLRGGKPLLDKGVHIRNAMSYRVDQNSVTIGVPFAWARVHQEGATINAKNARYLRFQIGGRWASKKSVTIPARPFFGISASDRAGIGTILRRVIAA